MVWYGVVWLGRVRFGAVLVRWGGVRFGLEIKVRSGLVWSGSVRWGLVWSGMVWCGREI